MNEIDELYSYVEMPQVAENLKAWKGSFPEGPSPLGSYSHAHRFSEWTKAPLSQRKAHVELLLEGLEHRDAVVRFTNARRLFYIVQGEFCPGPTTRQDKYNPGTFAETVSPEHQLHWIFENCKVVRAANGVSAILEALKIASAKHDIMWKVSPFDAHFILLPHSSLTDADLAQLKLTSDERTILIEEILTEISVYFGMMYHLIEIFKGHDEFADELSECTSIFVYFSRHRSEPRTSFTCLFLQSGR